MSLSLFKNKMWSSSYARHWSLDPKIVYLNHGAFGACPRVVLEYREQLSNRLEKDPWRFQMLEWPTLHRRSLETLADFVQAEADDLVFVPNVTHGVNTVLRSLHFQAGDELLTTDHEYFACRNALEFTAAKFAAKVIVVKLPFPIQSPTQIIEAISSAISERTRLALIDHITSPTGLILPVAEITRVLIARGIDVLIDGAHAPGMVPVNLRSLQATFYTGNCHKWICAPKGAAFLYVRRERQSQIHPLAISHIAHEVHPGTTDFQHEFFWAGTTDYAAYASVEKAIHFLGSLFPGGWEEVMARNHELAVMARNELCRELDIQPPCPDEMIGALASIPLPDAVDFPQPLPTYYIDPLQERLFQEYAIDVPIFFWPQTPKRILRISAQMYNDLSQYRYLARALKRIFE